MSANKYTLSITCPRCRFVGDVDESFPCDCGDVALAALKALSSRVERHMEVCDAWLRDHACGQCVPGGEIVRTDFLCARHAALALIAKAGK